jgi:hypothetical protein
LWLDIKDHPVRAVGPFAVVVVGLAALLNAWLWYKRCCDTEIDANDLL